MSASDNFIEGEDRLSAIIKSVPFFEESPALAASVQEKAREIERQRDEGMSDIVVPLSVTTEEIKVPVSEDDDEVPPELLVAAAKIHRRTQWGIGASVVCAVLAVLLTNMPSGSESHSVEIAGDVASSPVVEASAEASDVVLAGSDAPAPAPAISNDSAAPTLAKALISADTVAISVQPSMPVASQSEDAAPVDESATSSVAGTGTWSLQSGQWRQFTTQLVKRRTASRRAEARPQQWRLLTRDPEKVDVQLLVEQLWNTLPTGDTVTVQRDYNIASGVARLERVR